MRLLDYFRSKRRLAKELRKARAEAEGSALLAGAYREAAAHLLKISPADVDTAARTWYRHLNLMRAIGETHKRQVEL